MKDFYSIIKTKVQGGQYRLQEMVSELTLAYEKSRITLEQYEELCALAETSVDKGYVGNVFPAEYDKKQDAVIGVHDTSIIEIYEMLMGTVSVQTEKQQERIAVSFNVMARSGIGDIYFMMVLDGRKKFSEVHSSKQPEVAEKLIVAGRVDLIDVPEFLPHTPEQLPSEVQ